MAKRHKIMYVVEGLTTGNPRVDRLHVLQCHVTHWGEKFRFVRYRGWTDSGKHVKWYGASKVGLTPASAVKKARRILESTQRVSEIHMRRHGRLLINASRKMLNATRATKALADV